MTDKQQALFDSWTKREIYEAYLVAYKEAEEAQKRYNKERLAHIGTKREIMNKEQNYIMEATDRFKAEAGIEITDCKDYYKQILKLDGVFSCVSIGKGFIVGHVATDFLSPETLTCSEIAWYVEKNQRGTTTAIKLLKEYEQKAKELGATKIHMVCLERLNPEGTAKIYNKLGYNKFETHYIKEI